MTTKKEVKKKLARIVKMINGTPSRLTQEKRIARLETDKIDISEHIVFIKGRVDNLEEFNRDEVGDIKRRLHFIDEEMAILKSSPVNTEHIDEKLLRRIENLERWKKDVDGDLAKRVEALEQRANDVAVHGNNILHRLTALENKKENKKLVGKK